MFSSVLSNIVVFKKIAVKVECRENCLNFSSPPTKRCQSLEFNWARIRARVFFWKYQKVETTMFCGVFALSIFVCHQRVSLV